jgi:hypothetical protein
MRSLRLAVLALLLSTAPASAQITKALDLVPDDALGFILIKDLRQLSDKVEQLASKLRAPEHVSFLELVQVSLGRGLNEKGSAVIIVMKGKEKSKLAAIVALPVADYQQIARHLGVESSKEAISEGKMGAMSPLLFGIGGKGSAEEKAPKIPMLVARKGDFVLLTSPETREPLERVLKARASVTPALKPARDWLGKQDISGVCTHHGIQVGLAMILGGPGGAVDESTPRQYAELKGTFADIEKNVQLIAFGARIEKEGHSRLLTRVYLDPNGEYAKWLAKAEPVKGKVLARLPSQQYVLAVLARISPQTNFRGFTKLLWDALTPGEKAEQLSLDAARLLQRISEVGVGLYKDKAGKKAAGEVDSVQAAVVAKVDDAPKFVKEAVALLKNTQKAASAAGKGKAELEFRQQSVAGKPSQLITVRDAKGGRKEGERTKETAEEKPLVLLLSELDARTVLVCSLASADQAESAVKRFARQPGQALSSDKALQTTTMLMPPRHQVAAYLNIQTLGLLGVSTPSKTESPPLGFALSTFPGGVEAQFVIPYGALQAVFEGIRSADEAKEEKK